MFTKTKLVLAAVLVAGFASAGAAQDITDALRYENAVVSAAYGNGILANAYARADLPRASRARQRLDRQFEQGWFARASNAPTS